MKSVWLVDFFAEKSNDYFGSIICEYAYVLELPMPWQCGVRAVLQRLVRAEELSGK